MIKIDKKQVMDALKYIADYDFQKIAWLSTGAYPVSSFIEDYCGLFDDTGLSDTMKINQPVFSEAADQALIELRDAMDKVDDKRPPGLVLNDPLMASVREKAVKVLQLLQASEAV